MSYEMLIVLYVLALGVGLFVTERLRVDLVALLVMALLLISGIISPSQGLAGFSNSATITVGAMFVLSAGLFRTGAVTFLGNIAAQVFEKGFWFGIITVMLIVGVLSAFINNTPVIAIFLPILLGVARDTGISASRILMPVSFASMFGGVCTLIGTSTNILVSSIAEKSGLRAFTMFEFAPLGLVMFAFGTAYMLLVGIRLLPERRGGGDLIEDFSMNEYLTEVVISDNSISVGRSILESPLVHDLDLTILKIQSGEKTIQLPPPSYKLKAGDILLVRSDIERIRALQEREGVEFKPKTKWVVDNITQDEYKLLEAVIEPNSPLVGSTLQRSSFRDQYGATVLAIRHRGRLLREKLSDTVLGAGDVLLLEIGPDRIPALKRSGDFIITSEMAAMEFRRNKAISAILVVAGVVALAATGSMPIVVSAVVGTILMILLRCISIEEAYDAIDWKIIFLLAGVLSLGVALEESGTAALLSSSMLKYVGTLGPIAMVSAFYLLTSILTETMSNNATAALLAPIAIVSAKTMGVDPTPFLMAITFAASASFMTPVGYQTNTMIYGPGQYKFVDFIKVGTPLNVMFWILATILIPMIWSF